MLPKYFTASDAVASSGGSPAVERAMIGPNNRATKKIPMIPVARASAAYRVESSSMFALLIARILARRAAPDQEGPRRSHARASYRLTPLMGRPFVEEAPIR